MGFSGCEKVLDEELLDAATPFLFINALVCGIIHDYARTHKN